MKKRIGTLKGKPIVEGGGSNIIKENEININDIGSNKEEEEEKVWYFRDIFRYDKKYSYSSLFNQFIQIFFYDKIKECNAFDTISLEPVPYYGTFDIINIVEFSIGINHNSNNIFVKNTDGESTYKESIESFMLLLGFSSFESFIKFLNKYEIPISKEEFYRVDYTEDEFTKMTEECINLAKNLPEVPEID